MSEEISKLRQDVDDLILDARHRKCIEAAFAIIFCLGALFVWFT